MRLCTPGTKANHEGAYTRKRKRASLARAHVRRKTLTDTTRGRAVTAVTRVHIGHRRSHTMPLPMHAFSTRSHARHGHTSHAVHLRTHACTHTGCHEPLAYHHTAPPARMHGHSHNTHTGNWLELSFLQESGTMSPSTQMLASDSATSLSRYSKCCPAGVAPSWVRIRVHIPVKKELAAS